ncbi:MULTISPECIES: molybdenum cofactor biosynthesis protein MoaE [unclassified Nocardioides]|uniref:molybdopterin synthase catalytic subunit n=1 Tax=unclassified Nocardioides TaxID=2615069 RepID=UPI001EE3BD90|nr:MULTISPECIES: molybdenum cofactor biosynthesis protein MoaE [unclassified Nocardioides]
MSATGQLRGRLRAASRGRRQSVSSTFGNTPLSVDEVRRSLDDDASGGLLPFLGRVRDRDGGRSVDRLEYSAHPNALEQLVRVCEEVSDRHEVHGVAACHRVGTTGNRRHRSGHRDGLCSSRKRLRGITHLIDTLKSEVPIWKHQQFGDGTEEWVN